MLNFDKNIMYIYSMKFNIDKKKIVKSMQNGTVVPVCSLLILFLMFMMFDSVVGSILSFVAILLVNFYVFAGSDWMVSKKMDSVKTFSRVQNASLTFSLIEFVISLICVFCGLDGDIGMLGAGVVMLLLSVAGTVHSVLLKVDYDCFN